jgi:membrane fusion protein (multidrug efflux system)
MSYAHGMGAQKAPAAGMAGFDTAQGRALWRKRLLMAFVALLAFAAVAGGVQWYLEMAHYVSTDDAYVNASLADITPQIDGTISEVRVNDTDHVKRGDLLLKLDSADAELVLMQAQANYDQAVRRVKQYLANAEAAAANISGKRSTLQRTQLDLKRRADLSRTGAVSAEEVSTARNAMDAAQSDLSIAEKNLSAQRALVEDAAIDQNPEIVAARAGLEMAQLNLARTEIRAPIDGIVAKRAVQIGQRVKVGSPLMSVVPVAEAYVDANFKEVQIERIRPGQLVYLTSDLYGKDVTYHGRVAGVGGGTGSAFAIIPAQNATGNWIKVVQRLPVRITLDPDEVARNPLRVGLSMTVKVDLDESKIAERAPSLRGMAENER